MTKPQNIISFFCIKKSDLNHKEFWNIIIYCGSKRDTENWEVSIESGWLSGCCIREDKGIFYQFLKSLNLENKIEIIRG